MRKLFLFLISLVVGLAIFSFATSQVGLKEIEEAFNLFPSQGIILILGLTALVTLTCVWRLKFILKTQGHNLPFIKLAEIWVVGFAISYLTPIAIFGGEVLMIYLLRKEFNLSWEKSSASVFIHKVLDATIFFPFLIIGLFTFPILVGGFPKTNVIIAGGVTAGIVIALLAIFYIKSFRKESALEWFLKLFGMSRKKLEKKEGGRLILGAEQEIISFFGLKKKIMWQGLALSFLKYSFVLIRVWVLVFLFQGGWSLLRALSAYGFFNIAVMVPVPAMLGSLEAAESLAFSAMGMGANVGIAFSLVLRSMDVILCLIGLIVLVKVGMKLIKMKILEIIDKIVASKDLFFNNGN